MEEKNLEQVKQLINEIADCYDRPTEEQAEKMQKLTGEDWAAEDLQMLCCEYWSHNSLEETAYLMFHGKYPPSWESELVFWRYKPGVSLDDKTVYEKYRFGKGTLKALEALPLEEMLGKIEEVFSGWQCKERVGSERESYRFDCLEQADYWTDTHFWLFTYGRETDAHREHQMLRFSCHNMDEQQINAIVKCMESFQCILHIKEEKCQGTFS